jgi:3-phosphoshikimate 1-carboxyvinyltransferase
MTETYRILPATITEKRISLPTSKSISHRMCILGGLNYGPTRIKNLLNSEDIEITRTALENMGLRDKTANDILEITAPIGKVRRAEAFLGNSGSSARFLIPLAAYLDQPFRFYGTERLHERPFMPVFEACEQLGIRVAHHNGALPAVVHPSKVSGGVVRFNNLPTSQVITALMMAAVWMEDDLTIELTETIPSQPYVMMTYKLMKRLNLAVEYSRNTIWVKAQKPDFIWNYTVEKDLSAAGYWVVLGLIHGGKIIFEDVMLPSLQGDERIFEIAEMVGAEVMLYPDRVEVSGKIERGFRVDCVDIPDMVPTLAVLGLFAPEKVELTGVENLRFKESDRIAAVQQNIAALGGKTDYQNGVLTIHPRKQYRGAVLKSFNDHRIAMSFAVAGTRIPGVAIENPQCVVKSYPTFWAHLESWENLEKTTV